MEALDPASSPAAKEPREPQSSGNPPTMAACCVAIIHHFAWRWSRGIAANQIPRRIARVFEIECCRIAKAYVSVANRSPVCPSMTSLIPSNGRKQFDAAMMKMTRSPVERCLLQVRVEFIVAFIITGRSIDYETLHRCVDA
jgi:hypothetical protein